MLDELRALTSAYLTKVGEYQARALLTIVYWSVIAATWTVMRLRGGRLLSARTIGPNTFWSVRDPARHDPASMSRQY